jgi:hypothetical protein
MGGCRVGFVPVDCVGDFSSQRMDRTLISLVALVVATGGALTVFARVSIPNINSTYFGRNPFAEKRDTVNGLLNVLFTSVAVFGVALQAVALILPLPERNHLWPTYLVATITASAFTAVALSLLHRGVALWPGDVGCLKLSKGIVRFMRERSCLSAMAVWRIRRLGRFRPSRSDTSGNVE